MISLQKDLLTESLKLVQQEEKNHLSLKGKTLERVKDASSQKTLLFDKNDRRKSFTKDDSSKKFGPKSNNSLQSTLFHTQIFAQKKKVSLLNKGYAVKSRGSAVSKSSFARPRRTNRGSN